MAALQVKRATHNIMAYRIRNPSNNTIMQVFLQRHLASCHGQ